MSKQRVFIYRDDLLGGGAGKIIVDISLFLANNGYEVIVLCSNYLDLFGATHKNIRILSINFGRPDHIERALEYFSDTQNNVFISFVDVPIHVYIKNIFRLLNRKPVFWIYMETNHPSVFAKNYEKMMVPKGIFRKDVYDCIDIIRTENPLFLDYIDSANRHKGISIYNLAQKPESISPMKLEAQFNIVTTHGLRERRKSIVPLLSELTRAKELGLNLKLHILGRINKEIYKEAEAIINDNNLHCFVNIKDTVTNIHDYYQSMDIFATTATFEGTSNAVLEAFVHGLPVLGLKSSLGINETVIDKINGYLCNSPSDMMDKIVQLYVSPEKISYLSEGATNFSAKFNNTAETMARWLPIIKQGLEQEANLSVDENRTRLKSLLQSP